MDTRRSDDRIGTPRERTDRRRSTRFRWRIATLLALLTLLASASAAPNISADAMTLTSSHSGTVNVDLSQPEAVTLSLSTAPSMPVTVTLLSSDTEVLKLSSDGVATNAADRVTLSFTQSDYANITYTIHPIAGGRADIYQMMIPKDGSAYQFARLRVDVTESRQAGTITIRSTAQYPWQPLRYDEHPFGGFDHVFGETQHATYEVLVDPTVCPATVEIRGEPWSLHHGSGARAHRVRIMEGTDPPALTATEGREPVKQLMLDLHYSGADCMAPKSVTVYGLVDDDDISSFAKLTHMLVQTVSNSVTTRTDGPHLRTYSYDRTMVDISFVTVKHPSEAMVTRTKLSPGRTLVNGTRPESFSSHRTSTPLPRYNEITAWAQTQPAIGAMQWTEFCIFLHAWEVLSIANDGRITVPYLGRDRDRMLLPQITLFPARHDNRFIWFFGGKYRPHPDPDANGFLLPLEIQRYSKIVNGGTQCRPATTNPGGEWETVYSGGPSGGDTASIEQWKTTTKPNVKQFVIKQEDYGQFINLRIRGVNGVGPWDNDNNRYQVRSPSGPAMNIKFRIAELLNAQIDGTIYVMFNMPGTNTPGDEALTD